MRVPTEVANVWTNESLRKMLRSEYYKEKQRKEDKAAKQFLDGLFYMSFLFHQSGYKIKKIIANAKISYGEAVLLTGCTESALKSAAKNVYKLNDNEQLSLLNVIDIMRYEIIIYGRIDSYQHCVKQYINDFIKTEHQELFKTLCKDYFSMERDEAKNYESNMHILSEYFRMNPIVDKDECKNSNLATNSDTEISELVNMLKTIRSTEQKENVTTTQKTKKHGAISAKDSAKILRVSERTIRNWDAGANVPPGYPGRGDATAFHMFANQYLQNKRLAEQARAMNRASSGLGRLEDFSDKT